MKVPRFDAYCDGLAHDPETVEAVIERTVSIDGGGEHIVDLCEECNELVDLIAQMIGERAVPVPTKRRVAAKKQAARQTTRLSVVRHAPIDADETPSTTCPECGETKGTRDLLSKHTRMHHGKGLRDYPGFALPTGRSAHKATNQ